MKPSNTSQQAWSKLTQLAATAPPEPGEMPLGFATRVVAACRSQSRESALAMFEWLTLRGLAVTMIILLGCMAFSYQSVVEVVGGETALAGSWLESLLPL
ncbi:MAG: hypothetical protein RL693_1433 [Verrucomicrobiota bacterium]|jgi:hypothetical protein